MRSHWIVVGIAGLACAGCGESFRTNSSGGGTSGGGRQSPLVQVQTLEDLAKPAAAQPAASQPNAGQPAAGQPAGTAPAGQAPAQTGAAPATGEAGEPNRTRAEVGLGAKGQGYGGGLVSEPIRVRFRVEERLQLGQVKQAMDLFEATEGRAPKSHEEFMERIIQANSIQLPELPPGQTYVYDPQTKELMVEKPQ